MHHLTSEEAAGLLASISAFATRHDCRFEEAVRRLIAAAETSAGAGADAASPCAKRRFAGSLLRMRRRRSDVLDLPTLRDPAWDMLLDLYAQGGDGRGTKVTALCVASGVPQTTALRHLARLEQQQLVERQSDQEDLRRSKIVLTADATTRLERLLGMIQGTA